jgi:hypothetical protein
MNLPQPPDKYDRLHVVRLQNEIEREDRRNRKSGMNLELALTEAFILRSPNGARWQISVSNAGVISAVAL